MAYAARGVGLWGVLRGGSAVIFDHAPADIIQPADHNDEKDILSLLPDYSRCRVEAVRQTTYLQLTANLWRRRNHQRAPNAFDGTLGLLDPQTLHVPNDEILRRCKAEFEAAVCSAAYQKWIEQAVEAYGLYEGWGIGGRRAGKPSGHRCFAD
jgi:hypothetical protein